MKPIKFSELREEKIEWLWQDRIPLGGLTLLEGKGGIGKSFIGLEIAAALSNGRTLDGRNVLPGNTLILAAEDDSRATLLPRLKRMNAKLDRIYIVDEAVNIADDLTQIINLLKTNHIRFIVIDPLSYYIGASFVSEQKIRTALTPFVKYCTENKISILGVRHLTKDNKKGLGGVALSALSRSVLRAEESCLKNIKNNLSKEAEILYYEINDRVNWLAYEAPNNTLFETSGNVNMTGLPIGRYVLYSSLAVALLYWIF